jgi:hypothetical protein
VRRVVAWAAILLVVLSSVAAGPVLSQTTPGPGPVGGGISRSAADSRYVNTTGNDSMAGNLTVPTIFYGTGFTTTGVGTTSFQMNYYSNGLGMGSSGAVWFTSAGVNGTPDVSLVRNSAGVLKVTNGGAGNGNIMANAFVGAANEIAVNNDNTKQLKIRDTGTVDWSSTSTIGGTADAGLTRGAAKTVKVTDGSTGIGTLLAGRHTTSTLTPSIAATGYGASGSAALGTGSSDFAGTIILSVAGAGPAASGTATLTFSTTNGAYGTNAPVCVADFQNGTGTWNARVSNRVSSPTTTSVVFNWDNNAVALTAGSTYHINYVCIGK